MHPSCQFCIHVRHNRFGVAVEEAQLPMQDFMAAVLIGSIIFGGCTDRIDHALCRLKDFLQHDFVAPIIPEIISVTGLIFFNQKVIMQVFLFLFVAGLLVFEKEVCECGIAIGGFDDNIFLPDAIRLLDHEIMQMLILPIEQDLDDFVQLQESAVAEDLNFPPDRDADVFERDLE